MSLNVFLEIAVRHIFQCQYVVDWIPVFELYQSRMYPKSLVYLRLDRHLLPAY